MNPNHCAPHQPHGDHLKFGWINIYRSGWFHRAGKPNTFDRHAGDIYETKEEALKEIDPEALYLDTIAIAWIDPEDIQINPADSTPIGLALSRATLRSTYPSLNKEQ